MIYRIPPNRLMLAVRLLDSSDAKLLSDLARETYHETFKSTDPPFEHQRYLKKTYSEDKQRKELETPGSAALLLLVGGEPAGFVQLRQNTCPVDGLMSECQVWRFYLRKQYQGMHLGDILMRAAEWQILYCLGSTTAWLSVWENSQAAQNFYGRHGFYVVGQTEFWVSSDRQIDTVMLKNLT